MSRPAGALGETVEVLDHLVQVQHVGIFVVQIEQVDLVRQGRAVETALLHQRHVEAVGIAVDHAGANASAGAFAACDHAVDAHHLQIGHQRCAVEPARPLLADDQIALLGREFLLDVPVVVGDGALGGVAVGRVDPVLAQRSGGVDDGNL